MELRQVSADKRDAILAVAAANAERDYCKDRALTAFEAFGEDDLHADSSNTAPR